MKLTEKTKKYLVIAGGMVLGTGLIAAIGMQFGQPTSEEILPETTQTVTEVIVDPGTGQETYKDPKESTEESDRKTDLVIQAGTEETNGITGQAADSRPAQTDQIQQSIQPEPTKPEPPREEVLTDPTKKPDGTKVEEPPVPVDHESVEKPAEPDPGQPQAGDTSGNQIYVPGFGWVENHGGGGSGTVAEDMYENGNKIGIMD